MMRIFRFAFVGLLLIGGAFAQNICSVRVLVYNRNGQRAVTGVSLTMDDGRFVGSRVSKNGVAEFCDVGWGPFSVTVGQEMCGQVTVKYLHSAWSATLEVPVIYENCHGFQAPGGCLVLIRVLDDVNQPVKAAIVENERPHTESSTDRYGRAVFGMHFDETTTAAVRADGYQLETRHFTCTREKSDIEDTVQLTRH